MVNPIALAIMVLGGLVLIVGIFLIAKRRKIMGTIISLLGLGTAVIPFLTSFYLEMR